MQEMEDKLLQKDAQTNDLRREVEDLTQQLSRRLDEITSVRHSMNTVLCAQEGVAKVHKSYLPCWSSEHC